MPRTLLAILLVLYAAVAGAQVHKRGEVLIASGVSVGGYTWSLSREGALAISASSGPMAALPLTAHYGIGDRLALGGYAEVGIMSGWFGDDMTLWTYGIESKFYWLNKERFGASVSLRYGASSMSVSSLYTGANYGANLDAEWRFTEVSGLQIQVRYMWCHMEGEVPGPTGSTRSDFDTRWVTAGVMYVLHL